MERAVTEAGTQGTTAAYRADSSNSAALYARSRYSPIRSTAQSAASCRITDVEGEERIDFLNNFTSAILGHSNPEVLKAVAERMERGTLLSMPSDADVELAETITSRNLRMPLHPDGRGRT